MTPQASSIRAEVAGQRVSSSMASYNDARTRSNAGGSLMSPRTHESCGCTHQGRVAWPPVSQTLVCDTSERHHSPARSASRGEDLLALLAQLALRPDVPVERHGSDPEFAAECGHGGITVRHRGLGQPHLGFRQRERPAAVVVSIFAPCPVSTRRPTPRADRSCTVLTRWARGCGRAGRASRRRARRPTGARAGSCRVPGGRRGRRTRSRGRRGRRRRRRPAARRAAGPATGSRPPWRRGRSRSACVVNGRLRHIGTHTALAVSRRQLVTTRVPRAVKSRRSQLSTVSGHPCDRRQLGELPLIVVR